MTIGNIIKNFDIPVLDAKDNPIPGPEKADLTMREEIFTALMHPGFWDENTFMRKITASGLAMGKIYKGGEVELTPSERELIKERVCKVCYPLSVHRIIKYLDE